MEDEPNFRGILTISEFHLLCIVFEVSIKKVIKSWEIRNRLTLNMPLAVCLCFSIYFYNILCQIVTGIKKFCQVGIFFLK